MPIFACDVPATWYHEQVSEAITVLATVAILAMVSLQWQFSFKRNNTHIITHEVSYESL